MQLTLWVEGVTTTGTLAEVWAQVTGPDLDGFGGTEPVSDKVLLADLAEAATKRPTLSQAPWGAPIQ